MTEYMLVQKGYKYNRSGFHAERKGTLSLIQIGYEQVPGLNTYKTLAGAKASRKAIFARQEGWGYEEGDIQIAEIKIVA